MKITQEMYSRLREECLKDYIKFYKFSVDVKFTCDDCPARFDCEYVLDAYNTDGDCLAEK